MGKEAPRQKYPKSQFIMLISSAVVVLLLTGYAFIITGRLSESEHLYDEFAASFSNTPQPLGYACGLMNMRDAISFLGQEVERTHSLVPAWLSGTTRDASNGTMSSCRYQQKGASDTYAELFVYDLHDSSDAKLLFNKKLPEFGPSELQDAARFGLDELVYAEGVHYARKDNIVFSVSAYNSQPSQTKSFGEQVLERVVQKL